jgi:hypothetical protein
MITNVAAIHHSKILRLFGRYVERLEQAFREGQGGKAKGIVARQKRAERLQASALALPTEKAYRETEGVLPDVCAE